MNQQYQDGHRRCLLDFIIEADLEKKYAFVQERKDKHLGSGYVFDIIFVTTMKPTA